MVSRSKDRSGGAQTAVADKKCKRSSKPIPKRSAWKAVQVLEDVVSFTGGYNKAEASAKCISIRVGGKNHRFVELKKNNHWFLKGVGGPKILKGDLRCVHVLTVIRDTFNNWEEAETGTAVAEVPVKETAVAKITEVEMERRMEVEVDPMDEMDSLPSKEDEKHFARKKH